MAQVLLIHTAKNLIVLGDNKNVIISQNFYS